MNAIKKHCRIVFFFIALLQRIIFGTAGVTAQIIYTDPEPDLYLPTPDRKDKLYPIDIDKDANVDFAFSYDDIALSGYINIIPYNQTEFIGLEIDDYIASPDTLSYYDPIDESRNWMNRTDLLVTIVEHDVTIWGDSNHKFMGLRIKNDSGYRYGWIRMKDQCTLADYALNSQYNSRIFAGEGISPRVENLKISDIDDFKNGRDLSIEFEPFLGDRIL
ncbi:MAG TPA: hypothetical protein PLK12_14050, partial [Prolixibacteraceae bacterium]|nr:hypothetical protein [Prolixibacteraceae bacterium]